MFPTPQALNVTRLGSCHFRSPLEERREHFASEATRVLLGSTVDELEPYLASGERPPSFEAAGPRRELFFDPQGLRCGVVTCGGLCPGLNDVVRSLVMTLVYGYGVEQIDGFRYGYAGLARGAPPPLALTPELVADSHKQGGTLLGSSRGPQDVVAMVDTLVARRIGILFAIGGDGTLRGASALSREVARQGLAISVVGVPKTIDNDLYWIERSFGFATAVEEATHAVAAAHTEARGAYNGVGLVKLMGRHSGFITAHAALANSDVNFCLVPEVPFGLYGEGGFLPALEARLAERHHAVVAVAEGAAQELLCGPLGCDPSGNVRLGDVGPFLREEIGRFLGERRLEATVRYIDPSYIIRSSPANALDSEYCLALGQYAVHAGMAGRTDMMVGYWNQRFTHVPLAAVTERRKQIEPSSDLWQHVLGATGQPSWQTSAA